MNRILLTRILFWIALAFCLTPWASPPIALAIGLAIGLTLGHPYAAFNKRATKVLLQVSVVGLGFGINLQQVLSASRDGVVFTIATIVGTLVLGWLIGRMLGIDRKTAHLISSGTAICGGSAIAAVGPVLDAGESEMSVSLGTVFILNSVALFLFPAIGHMLDLSQTQFGIWAAIAIHDTSSVVGAAARYGEQALGIATTVKLARALWIVPLVFATSLLFRHGGAKVSLPWFILYFLVASVLRSYIPLVADISPTIVAIAKIGLTITLFLIGAGLSRRMLSTVGARPLVLGVLLWIVISTVSLWAVTTFLH
ncbi:MAG TPA: putative sulfate exporter family transporter [Candidatus Kapabacteria bacterium]|nr:putative sulfate exporter family transporter [Candidatus Kapabacteria bacterium]